jgi:ceramide glucosyltransferase
MALLIAPLSFVARWLILLLACLPLAYYLFAIFCALEFFSPKRKTILGSYLPPVSVLKPVRGLDREAYENFASYCRQDYPQHEILFAVNDADDPAVPVIQRLMRDFPEKTIRLLTGAPRLGASSKVNKLCLLAREARNDLLVISDSDVRVEPQHLRQVAALFADPQVGAVTALFRGMVAGDLASELDSLGASAGFCPSVLVSRKLEGMKFTLGATMATTKRQLAEIGGFEAFVNHHSDDFELGKRIAARGHRIELLREPVWMLFPARTLGHFLQHERRWAVGVRNVRPFAHLGLLFSHGLFWALLAAAIAPAAWIAALYLAAYLFLRFTVAWTAGAWGLHDPVVRRRIWLVPLQDAFALGVWLASFASNRVYWRGEQFKLRKGILVPLVNSRSATRRK